MNKDVHGLSRHHSATKCWKKLAMNSNQKRLTMKNNLTRKGLYVCLLLSFCLSAFTQGTAFTYQGQLNDGGAPANGTYDLLFTIYASSNGVNDAFANQTNSGTLLSNGLFTVNLD